MLPNSGFPFSEPSGQRQGVLGALREEGRMLIGIVMRSQCPGPASTSAQRGYCASVLSLVLFCFPASRPHSPGLATAPPRLLGPPRGARGVGDSGARHPRHLWKGDVFW